MRWSAAAAVMTAAVVATIAIPFLASERLDRIAVRDIAKRPVAAPTAPVAPSAAPLAWTLPAGWSPAPPKEMRLAVFAIDGGGECGVFLFPGGGGRLANVNRWRAQAGLPPLADEAALDHELTSGTCAFGPFAWLAVRGEGKAFLAAIAATPDGQCFVKLEAPADRLDALRAGFLAFCASLRPGTP